MLIAQPMQLFVLTLQIIAMERYAPFVLKEIAQQATNVTRPLDQQQKGYVKK
jgi:hypothetical protein